MTKHFRITPNHHTVTTGKSEGKTKVIVPLAVYRGCKATDCLFLTVNSILTKTPGFSKINELALIVSLDQDS